MTAHKKLAFGLIADGNRRWAKGQNLPTGRGHEAGFEVIRTVLLPALYDHPDWDRLAIYAFSTENWGRSPSEVKDLMKLFQRLDKWGEELHQKKIRLVHAGRKDRLPKALLKTINYWEEATAENQAFTVVVCLDYGSQDEITRAVEAGGSNFTAHLEVPPLDLILRTGGEQRLSNFCLWQAAYAEFCFTNTFLPDLNAAEVTQVLEDFAARDKRKGK